MQDHAQLDKLRCLYNMTIYNTIADIKQLAISGLSVDSSFE